MDPKEFGAYIARLREKAGYNSQAALAKASGVWNSTIARIEAGQTKKPDPETLAKLAPCLNVTVEHLMRTAGYFRDDEPDKPYIIREEENGYHRAGPPADEEERKRKEQLRRVLEDPTITDLLLRVPDLTEEEKESLKEHWAYIMDFIERKRQERKKQQSN
jgi:transcriptional regulator with XRE-family HTH domain